MIKNVCLTQDAKNGSSFFVLSHSETRKSMILILSVVTLLLIFIVTRAREIPGRCEGEEEDQLLLWPWRR